MKNNELLDDFEGFVVRLIEQIYDQMNEQTNINVTANNFVRSSSPFLWFCRCSCNRNLLPRNIRFDWPNALRSLPIALVSVEQCDMSIKINGCWTTFDRQSIEKLQFFVDAFIRLLVFAPLLRQLNGSRWFDRLNNSLSLLLFSAVFSLRSITVILPVYVYIRVRSNANIVIWHSNDDKRKTIKNRNEANHCQMSAEYARAHTCRMINVFAISIYASQVKWSQWRTNSENRTQAEIQFWTRK